MNPNFLIQIFKRHGPFLSPNGWLYVGATVAGVVFAATFLFRWR